MEKIKLFIESDKGKDILIILIVILVGVASFELGRLSKEDSSNGLKIDYKGLNASVLDSFSSNTSNSYIKSDLNEKSSKIGQNQGNYFASKKGKKYYSVGCSAGKTIKIENRIYFSSAEIAEQNGYTLSTSCR